MAANNEERTSKEKCNDEIKQTKVTEVISAIKPVILIENLFGIFRFSFVDGKLRLPNRNMKLFAVIMPAVYIALYALAILCSESRNCLITIIDVIPSNVVLAHYAISAITTTFLLGQTCVHLLETFADLDAMLLIETTKEFYNRCKYKTRKYLILLTVFHIISCVLELAIDDKSVFTKLIIVLLYFIENLEILIFCKLIVMLKSRLQIINSYLTTFIQGKQETSAFYTVIFSVSCRKVTSVDNFNWIGHASVHNMKIRDLAAMYDMIGTICSLINEVSNLQIFMTLVSTFSYILVAIWSIIYFFRTSEYTLQWLITIIVWCFTSLFTVAVMCYSCERLLSERNRTKVLVNQIIMDYELPKTMRVQAKAFMELIEAWPLRVFIYDMFSVDITLMLKFISVATTYLIVIIQISHFV